MNMWLIVLFLLAGFLIGYFRPFPARFFKLTKFITMGGLIILLMAMGAKIGIDDRILSQLDKIGFKALLLAGGSIIGSVFFITLFSKKLNVEIKSPLVEEKKLEKNLETGLNKNGNTNKFMTFIIIFSIISGILLGLFILPASFFSCLDIITTYALGFLLLGVGIDIGRNKDTFSQVKQLGWHVILIPFIIAIGSIAGTVFLGIFLGLTYNEAAAVGAGFGWYSLSGILLAQIYSIELGTLAFLTNVFRELISILIVPFVVKYFGKLASIAPGGATSMDVSLPIIKEAAGEELVIPAFISGIILSTLVPFLVPFLINL